jgi:hypothetical protein
MCENKGVNPFSVHIASSDTLKPTGLIKPSHKYKPQHEAQNRKDALEIAYRLKAG